MRVIFRKSTADMQVRLFSDAHMVHTYVSMWFPFFWSPSHHTSRTAKYTPKSGSAEMLFRVASLTKRLSVCAKIHTHAGKKRTSNGPNSPRSPARSLRTRAGVRTRLIFVTISDFPRRRRRQELYGRARIRRCAPKQSPCHAWWAPSKAAREARKKKEHLGLGGGVTFFLRRDLYIYPKRNQP